MSSRHRGGGERKPAHLQMHVSWYAEEKEALSIAHDQWGTNAFGPTLSWNLETPARFDAAARHVRAEDVKDAVLVSSDLGEHIGWLHRYLEMGFDRVYVHHVGVSQQDFIATWSMSCPNSSRRFEKGETWVPRRSPSESPADQIDDLGDHHHGNERDQRLD